MLRYRTPDVAGPAFIQQSVGICGDYDARLVRRARVDCWKVR